MFTLINSFANVFLIATSRFWVGIRRENSTIRWINEELFNQSASNLTVKLNCQTAGCGYITINATKIYIEFESCSTKLSYICIAGWFVLFKSWCLKLIVATLKIKKQYKNSIVGTMTIDQTKVDQNDI